MIIPKSFKLYNQTIRVVYSRTLLDKQEAYGLWDLNKNKIYLQQSTRKHPLTKEQIEQTFLHEFFHAALELSGELKLSGNEKFVCSMSNLIHQLLEQI